MINLVIDLSNMFFRSTFTVGGYGKNKYTFDSQRETDQLMRKVATDISSIIRQTRPSRVIFALDSKSWRKEIQIDENEGYKGHREKSEFINWDNVYSIMDDFGEIVKSRGMIISKIKNAEADDLICMWAEYFQNLGEHCIIVSGDEDLKQLVGGDNNKWITVFNPFVYGKNGSKKLFGSENFIKWLNTEDGEGSIFDRNIDVDKEDFKSLLKDRVKLESISGKEVLLSKIFCGDDGDNVPAIYTWLKENKKGEIKVQKEERITPSKMEKILTKISIGDVSELLSEKNKKIIFDELKTISGTFPPFKIEDRINRQLKLVALRRDFFPPEIVKTFDEEIHKTNMSRLASNEINMNSILDGTKYVDPNYNRGSKEAPIFNQIDRISNKSLF